ncbi:hypothetical protein PFISCL1PPCAC_10934, partial [Pristionchus fissidentatus]
MNGETKIFANWVMTHLIERGMEHKEMLHDEFDHLMKLACKIGDQILLKYQTLTDEVREDLEKVFPYMTILEIFKQKIGDKTCNFMAFMEFSR